MINLKLDLHEIRGHAQDYMRELGIQYQHATPQSITDSWWFWNCMNVPSPLPKGLKVLNIKPREAIGWGLSAEIADALEQPEQKAECDGCTCGLGGYCDGCPNRPVAWQWLNTANYRKKLPADAEPGAWNPLYTHPPRREWRGLKEWEIIDGREQLPTEDLCNWSFRKGVEFAEAALKEKNHEHEGAWVKTYCGGKANYTQRFTLSCGCPSQYGGVPAYWERDGSTAFGMICEKHWYEYGARSEA